MHPQYQVLIDEPTDSEWRCHPICKQLTEGHYRRSKTGKLSPELLRYQDKELGIDVIDAFIYPIRETDWSNTSAALTREADNFRKEMELVEREGAMRSITLEPTETISWESEGQIYQGRKIAGIAISNDENTYRTFMYLFVKEDKFIKIRASFVQAEDEVNIDSELKHSLNQFSVPKESLFMAKMRQHERENTIQD